MKSMKHNRRGMFRVYDAFLFIAILSCAFLLLHSAPANGGADSLSNQARLAQITLDVLLGSTVNETCYTAPDCRIIHIQDRTVRELLAFDMGARLNGLARKNGAGLARMESDIAQLAGSISAAGAGWSLEASCATASLRLGDAAPADVDVFCAQSHASVPGNTPRDAQITLTMWSV